MIPIASPNAGCGNHTNIVVQDSPFGNINKNSWLVFETRRNARPYRAIVMNNLRRAGMHVFTQGHQVNDAEINFLRAFIVKTRFSARLTSNTLKYLYRRASRRVFGITNNLDIELQPRLIGACSIVSYN